MTIKTESELLDILGDPAKMADYIGGVIAEKMGGVTEAAGAAVATALKDHGVKRLPMGGTSEAVLDSSAIAAGAELDGKFKRFGEFLKVASPGYIQQYGFDPRLKNLNEGAGGDGGFTVPEEFRAQLLKLSIEDAKIRPRAFKIPMASSSAKIPAIRDTSHATNLFGGVQAYWAAEAATLTSSQPTFRQIELIAKKLTGYTAASNELLADNAIMLESLLMQLFGTAIAFFEDDAFFNGNGNGQPLGILNAPALISVAKETGQAAATIVTENIDKMYSQMLPSSYDRAVWFCSPSCLPQIFALSRVVGVGGAPVMVANIAGAPFMSIYGRPLIVTEQCQVLGTVGDLFFTDLNYYVIADRQAVTMAASPHVNFTSDETVWRFTERLDGQPWIDSALTPRHGSTTLSPFVALATRA